VVQQGVGEVVEPLPIGPQQIERRRVAVVDDAANLSVDQLQRDGRRCVKAE
jgi:hypothetical protein